MKRSVIVMVLFVLVAGLLFSVSASAQLVNIDKQYVVQRLDFANHRIAVQGMENHRLHWIDVNSDTQVLGRDYQPIYWNRLQPGQVIEVRGGLELSGHIMGKTIQVVG